MALKDLIPFGVSLPHRSLDPLPVPLIVESARRAEAIGFREVWVAENTVDAPPCLDALTLLGFAAGVTSTIGLGVAVVVLPLHSPLEIAHRVATLDFLSGGRVILGVGIGAVTHYQDFQVPREHRVTRFRESIELMRRLWSEEEVTFDGRCYSIKNATMGPKPVQKPYPPIWLGGDHPDNLKRAAAIADGWIAGGGTSNGRFAENVVRLRTELEKRGRDPSGFNVSKRLWLFVDDNPRRAREEVDRWFGALYHDSSLTDSVGVWGTAAQVHEQLEYLVEAGANHLLLNPVSHYGEQLDQLAAIIGFDAGRQTW